MWGKRHTPCWRRGKRPTPRPWSPPSSTTFLPSPPTAPLLIVLDDYHLIQHPPLHKALNQWLDAAPPHVHLLLTSRADPPLALARRRARRQRPFHRRRWLMGSRGMVTAVPLRAMIQPRHRRPTATAGRGSWSTGTARPLTPATRKKPPPTVAIWRPSRRRQRRRRRCWLIIGRWWGRRVGETAVLYKTAVFPTQTASGCSGEHRLNPRLVAVHFLYSYAGILYAGSSLLRDCFPDSSGFCGCMVLWQSEVITGVWRILDLRGFHLWCKCNNMVKKPRRSSLVEQKTPVSSNNCLILGQNSPISLPKTDYLR
jgi:hypothetical protein